WLARLYREGVEPSGSLQKVSDRSLILLFWIYPGAREVSFRSLPRAFLPGRQVMGLCVRAGRQAQRKHRTFARFARCRHVAAHHAREFAGDGKPESRAAVALRGRGIGLGELLEQLRLLFRSHADTGVGDGELDPVATVGDPPCPQSDLAFLGKLAGIA